MAIDPYYGYYYTAPKSSYTPAPAKPNFTSMYSGAVYVTPKGDNLPSYTPAYSASGQANYTQSTPLSKPITSAPSSISGYTDASRVAPQSSQTTQAPESKPVSSSQVSTPLNYSPLNNNPSYAQKEAVVQQYYGNYMEPVGWMYPKLKERAVEGAYKKYLEEYNYEAGRAARTDEANVGGVKNGMPYIGVAAPPRDYGYYIKDPNAEPVKPKANYGYSYQTTYNETEASERLRKALGVEKGGTAEYIYEPSKTQSKDLKFDIGYISVPNPNPTPDYGEAFKIPKSAFINYPEYIDYQTSQYQERQKIYYSSAEKPPFEFLNRQPNFNEVGSLEKGNLNLYPFLQLGAYAGLKYYEGKYIMPLTVGSNLLMFGDIQGEAFSGVVGASQLPEAFTKDPIGTSAFIYGGFKTPMPTKTRLTNIYEGYKDLVQPKIYDVNLPIADAALQRTTGKGSLIRDILIESKPTGQVRITSQPVDIASVETPFGKARIAATSIEAMDFLKQPNLTKTTTIPETPALVINFDKPVPVADILTELNRPESPLKTGIEEYTGMKIENPQSLFKNVARDASVEQIGILYGAESFVSITKPKGYLGYITGKKTTTFGLIKSEGLEFVFPEKYEFNVKPKQAKQMQGLSKNFKDLVVNEKGFVEISGIISESGESGFSVKGSAGGSFGIKSLKRMGYNIKESDLYFHSHPPQRLIDPLGRSLQNTLEGEFRATSINRGELPSGTDIGSYFASGSTKPEFIVSKKGITVYQDTGLELIGSNIEKRKYAGKLTFDDLRKLGVEAKFVPYERISQLGSKYQSSFGYFKSGGKTGIAVSKTKLLAETPSTSIYQSMTKIKFIDSPRRATAYRNVVISNRQATGSKPANYFEVPTTSGTQTQIQPQTFAKTGQGTISMNLESGGISPYSRLAGAVATMNVLRSSERNEMKGLSYAIGSEKTTTQERSIIEPKPIFIDLGKTSEKGIGSIIPKPIFIDVGKSSERSSISPINPPVPIEISFAKEEQTPISLNRFTDATIQQTQQKQSTIFKPAYSPIEIPKIPIVQTFKPRTNMQTKRLATLTQKRQSSGFDVFLKRFGQFRKVTKKPLPKQEAIAFGITKAKGGLGATFKLKASGRQVEEAPTSLKGNEYRNEFYKKGQDTFIQKARFRLGTLGERAEIKAARRGWFSWMG